MDKDTLTALADKFVKGLASEEEAAALHQWYDDWQDTDEEVVSLRPETVEEAGQRILAVIQQQIQDTARDPARLVRMRRRRLLTIAGAAAIFLSAVISAWLFFNRPSLRVPVQKELSKNDIAPGGNKAILTLADGSRVVLDSVKTGMITRQANARVLKTGSGQLVYKPVDGQAVAVQYNTLTTPRGGKYTLSLPDGTEVWLNAASSIRYPTAFTGNNREVEITGEAYFEVAHHPSRPFVVRAGELQVKVLGTHFDINSYENEPAIKTTLLEGAVQVSAFQEKITLAPGQQAVTSGHGGGIRVTGADVEEAVAWINGKFKFRDTDLKTVMRQLERWYDIEVVYEGRAPDAHFFGGTPMSVHLSEVLKVLALNGIHCRIEGKTLIVYP